MNDRNSIKEKINQILEVYVQKTTLRAVINAIPYIGGSLDVLLSSKGQKIVEERLLKLFKQLNNDIIQIKEENIDKEFVESEECFDLVRKIIEASIKTSEQEKIVLYSRILQNSCLKDIPSREKIDDFIGVLTELSVRELFLSKALYSQQKDGPSEGENNLQWARRSGWNDLPIKINIPKEDLDFLLKRLERTGLIKEITGTFYDYTGGVYVITETFKEIMKFIEYDDQN